MTQKYTTANGIRKYNPAYVPPPNATKAAPFVNQATALPVIPSPTAPSLEEEEIIVIPTTTYEAAVVAYHEEAEPEIYFGGYNGEGDSLDELNNVMAKYEVPAGLLAKLLQVKEFQLMEIIVDDSGSMNCRTDALDPITGSIMSRWWEAKWRISQMIELLAYVPAPPIKIYFLNRRDIISIEKSSGELPSDYIKRAESILMGAFGRNPGGTTPALEAIEASLSRNGSMKVMRYFLGDGQPNGGEFACKQIRDMIIHRPAPRDNPFTFMSCTNEDDQVEWMKITEEKAPYCAEFDDYLDEAREVLKDQGNAFPYSFGLHIVAQIVAAFNPHDLDAMDESLPFTKALLDSLLGYQSSQEEYHYYFTQFIAAQKKLPLKSFQHAFVRQLPSLYNDFLSAANSSDIPAAARYKQQVKQASSQPGYIAGNRGNTTQASTDCCVIL
mmetsp:Transcript_18165/g.27857  ORF Transcript_18165/g.27857 Transcript_18165/m.27857 type:complete len:440 (+) Transcript_18165:80-1399(+)